MSEVRRTPGAAPAPPPEELTTVTFDPTAHLTEEQKKWRVAKVVQRERFTMLAPMGPNNLTDEQKSWPVAKLDDLLPTGVGEAELTVLRGLIARHGTTRLHHLIEALASGGTAEIR